MAHLASVHHARVRLFRLCSSAGAPGRNACTTSKGIQRPIFAVFALLLFIAILSLCGPARAAPSDCIGESADGRAICTPPDVKPWVYGLCDEAGPTNTRAAAWCSVRGGTYNGPYASEECSGITAPLTEGSLAGLAAAFGTALWTPGSCGGGDTGWGTNITSNFCWSGGTRTQNGIILGEFRQFIMSCSRPAPIAGDPPITGTEVVSARKDRDLVCPPNTTSRTVNGAMVCVRPPPPKNNCNGDGNPICPELGQKIQVENDGVFDGWPLSRLYFSFGSLYAQGEAANVQSFGVRWRDAFDYRLQPLTGAIGAVAALSLPDGSLQYFRSDGSAVINTNTSSYRLASTPSGFDVTGNEVQLRFDSTGKLTVLSTSTGRIFTLTYADGTTGTNGQIARSADGTPYTAAVPANRLIKVVSDTGRILRYERDVAGKITQMRIGSADPTRYYYDKDDLVAKVVYPGGQTRNYHYNEAEQTGGASLTYALTGISDVNGQATPVRYATFYYEASGRAIVTEHAGGADRYSLQFSSSGLQTTVTDPLGTDRVKTFADVLGVRLLISVSQPAGSGSPAATTSITYDANANPASVDDYNGVRTCTGFDGTRNLELVRVEGLSNAQACSGVTGAGASLPAGSRKITKQWHPDWKLETKVAEPKKITTYVYNGQPDPFAGGATASCASPPTLLPGGQPIAVLCRRVEQATTDVDGSQGFGATLAGGTSRENKWTYNARGQALTHDGPRTDVNDITTYAYYADTTSDHTIGDLQSVTNPAGHVTQFTIYDVEGRVKRSIAPNGVVTDTTYTPRGWVATVVVTAGSAPAQTTTYNREPDGRIASVTLPDGVSLTYSYDAAKRLTGITDSVGNTVTYGLDPAGNKLSEQYRDANGTLARNIERVFDPLGRPMSVTGAAK